MTDKALQGFGGLHSWHDSCTGAAKGMPSLWRLESEGLCWCLCSLPIEQLQSSQT